MTDTSNAQAEIEEIEDRPQPEQEAEGQETSKPNGKDLEAAAESRSENELNGSSEADQDSPETSGQDEEQEQQTEKSEVKRRARDRIQQLVAQKRQAEAEAQSYKSQLEKLSQQIAPPGDDATQEEIDRYNLRQVMREERASELSSEAENRVVEAHASRQSLFEAKVQAAADRMPDALQKFYSVKCSDYAADYIAESEKAAELANYLGSNPVEAARIHTLTAIRQGAELARLEARLSAAPTAKKATNAPRPPSTISSGSATARKSPGDMSEAEYFAWREKMDKRA